MVDMGDDAEIAYVAIGHHWGSNIWHSFSKARRILVRSDQNPGENNKHWGDRLARKKTAEQNIEVAPQGSDTAKFEVGKVEELAEDAARVAVTWTDLDHTGQPQTNEMLWMLRKGSAGWRIAGMAAEVFPGEPPLLLDFEKPEETLKKLAKLEAEMRRRAEAEIAQSQQPKNPEEPIRQ
jgi:hypothetical protein